MEEEIAAFMMKEAKFEFFLVNCDPNLAHTKDVRGLTVISGINWKALADYVEAKFPFKGFDFKLSGFKIFKDTAPQYLVLNKNGNLGWDSDDLSVDSWDQLLSRGFAQFRNNVAHGNKHHMAAPFTHERTREFLAAAPVLIDFIASNVFDMPGWETPLMFR